MMNSFTVHISIWVLGLLPMCIKGQSKFIPHIPVDSLFILPHHFGLGIISANEYYSYNLRSVDIMAAPQPTIPATPDFFFPEGNVNAYAPYQAGLLIGIGKQLYFYERDHLRKWSIPLENLDTITMIVPRLDDFYLLSGGEIFQWRNDLYDFERISIPASITSLSYNLDAWGFLWATDGEIIYRIGKGNSQLPTLYVDIPKANNEQLSFRIEAYHPQINKLQIEYQIVNGNNTWNKVENGQLVDLSTKDLDEISIRGRASIDNKYYSYIESQKINLVQDSSRTMWGLSLILATGILGLAALFLHREKVYRNRLTDEKARNQTLRDLRSWKEQAHQLQMNPHFIFNALNSISSLIALNENTKARKYLQKFSTMMRSMLKQNIEQKVSISEEIKYLQDYLSIEQFSRGHNFTFEIIDLTSEDYQLPPMLIQPLAENAIIHGFKNINYPGEVKISFMEDNNQLVVKVEDNGVGLRAKPLYNKDDNSSQHKSVALDLIRKRLNNISKFEKGRMEMKDRNVTNPENHGTLVILHIPIQ